MNSILTAVNLTKAYGSAPAVTGVDLDVDPKEIYGLLGPNGSGKTTILSMLAGITRPDSGFVHVGGIEVSHSAARAKIGFVPQEIALYPRMTTAENLRFFGRMQGINGKTLRKRVGEALEIVDLAAYADSSIDRLSSGMKRRANIAAALVHSPDVIIMDEPTVGVDLQSRNAILDRIATLADNGSAVVFASHYIEEVQRLSTRVGVIDAGRILATGTIQELIAKSASRSHIVLTADVGVEQSLRLLSLQQPSDGTDIRRIGSELQIRIGTSTQMTAQFLRMIEEAGIAVQLIQIAQPTLEDVFLELTGRTLRQ